MTTTFSRRSFLQQAAVAAGAACASSSLLKTLADDQVQVVAPFGDPHLIAGNARERGRAYGKLFSDGIREFYDREIVSAFVGKPSMKEDLDRYSGACWKVIQSECPIIADELEGMAEGSGLRIEDHVLITLHEELYHRSVLPPVPHCTAVAVGKPMTKDNTAFVGQTWDWMPSVAGMSRLLRWQRDDGPSLLAYAFPGLWVGAGMNANGLALCWTSADLGKPNQSPRVGLPSYVILAHLLYQESLDEVREVANRNRHAGWFTFVMSDAQGRLMNIEGSPEGIEVVETNGQLIRIGFGTHKMSKTPEGTEVNVHARCKTMASLLNEEAGKVTLATMQQSFADPARGICVGKNTIDMMVYDTTHLTAYLSRGADYGVKWREYTFESPASQ